MKFKKEAKIGGVMVIVILLLFWGANYLKGTNLLNKNKHFYAIYNNVGGLTRSNPVLVNGFKVGSVEKIEFLEDNSGRLRIQFSVTNKDLFLAEDTEAKIISDGLLGSKAIKLLLGTSEKELESGTTLESSVEASLQDAVSEQIAPLKRKAEGLISTIDSAIVVVSAIFNKQARNDLDSSFASIRGTLQAFEKTMESVNALVEEDRAVIKSILVNVESITGNFEKNGEKLNKTLANIEKVSDSLAAADLKRTVDMASKAMGEVATLMEKVNNGEGSLGALLKNDTLYYNLEAAAYDLDQLMLDMRLNPERYVHFSVFGRKPKESPAEKQNKSE